jgi:hypothetical protein
VVLCYIERGFSYRASILIGHRTWALSNAAGKGLSSLNNDRA